MVISFELAGQARLSFHAVTADSEDLLTHTQKKASGGCSGQEGAQTELGQSHPFLCSF